MLPGFPEQAVGATSGPGWGSSLSWWMEMEANGADSSDPSRELGHPIQIMTVVSIFWTDPSFSWPVGLQVAPTLCCPGVAGIVGPAV